MKQKINVAEILEEAPKGTKLWCDAYGNVTLDKIDNAIFPISLYDKKGEPYRLTHNGSLYDYTPCILWPSKDCRTWENFKAPWSYRHFAPFQQILYKEQSYGKWQAGLYSHYQQEEDKVEGHKIIGKEEYVFGDDLILPYSGNEDKLGKETE